MSSTGRGAEALGLGGGDEGVTFPLSDQADTKKESLFEKAKTWTVGAGAIGTGALLVGSFVYWRSAKRPKGKRKKNGRLGRLVGIGGISLGISTLLVSGLIHKATGVAEEKVQGSPILRALL